MRQLEPYQVRLRETGKNLSPAMRQNIWNAHAGDEYCMAENEGDLCCIKWLVGHKDVIAYENWIRSENNV